MSEHEPCTGQSDDWYTPPLYFERLGLRFALDPCSPGPDHWVPAEKIYTKADDGLGQPWGGVVFMNPPFGGRNGQVPWLEKFFAHGNGIALVAARTSSGWFHKTVAPVVETLLFPEGKTKFVRGTDMQAMTRAGVINYPAGSIGKSPGTGVMLLGMGQIAREAMHRSGLGFCVNVR